MKYRPCRNSNQPFGAILILAACLSGVALPSSVEAGTSATVELVALSGASPDDVVTTLPTPQAIFAPGTTFFVEVWAQTGNIDGLSSVSVDVAFDAALATVVSVTHTALFSELQNGDIDNASGLVDNLSGSHFGPCSDQVAVVPDWGRVAIIEMTADALGSMSITSAPTGSLVFGTAVCGVGDLDLAKHHLRRRPGIHRRFEHSNRFAVGSRRDEPSCAYDGNAGLHAAASGDGVRSLHFR